MSENFKLLIVEDDPDARSNMRDILSLDGYQIQAESHCLPAINAVENNHFDAVIVDWRLPDGSGGDLIPIIKQRLPDSPVIVVTGMREFNTAVKALRKGAYDFLTKPINPDALRSLIVRLVERRDHLAEIASAQDRLLANARLAAIGEMVAGLAHESRNAFQRSHACLAELSLDLEDKPESLSLVGKIQKALDDLNFLLEEVRQYAAPINLERRKCCLKELVWQAWQEILEAQQLAAVPDLTINVADDFPKMVKLDCDRLRQVIRNLLENAAHGVAHDMTHAGVGGRKISVGLAIVAKSRKQSKMIEITVSDNGSGVPEDLREQIFTPFFTTKTKGTGLGLAICRRIIDAHHGVMFVCEADGGGAKFVIRLPAKQYLVAQ